MHDAIRSMLDRYECRSRDEYINALREILQDLTLLGLWRSKFFEHAAFYGGTALRLLYGLDRYSEDLDFSLLSAKPDFQLGQYGEALQREIRSFGFNVAFEPRQKTTQTSIESAFLKTNTLDQLIVIEADEAILGEGHPRQRLKIKLEIDIDPPQGFETESKYVLLPVPFSIRVYSLPDLLAGKLHAVLCRRWRSRVKGRDWYDLVWYAGRYPEVRLSHLEERMRQSGDYTQERSLTISVLREKLHEAVDALQIDTARQDVMPFVRDQKALDVWSKDLFHSVIQRIGSV
jgi:predicted nucleotidyltransferase component of viral defense system